VRRRARRLGGHVYRLVTATMATSVGTRVRVGSAGLASAVLAVSAMADVAGVAPTAVVVSERRCAPWRCICPLPPATRGS